MEEKRQFIRFQAPFCIQYNIPGGEDFSGVIKDISMGGARIALDTMAQVRPESTAALSIFLPENSLQVSGKVVWARDCGQMKEIGFCFAASTEAGRKKIHQYILKHFNQSLGRQWWHS